MTFICQSCKSEIIGGLAAPTDPSSPYIISCQRCRRDAPSSYSSMPDVKIVQAGGALIIEYITPRRKDKLKLSLATEAPSDDPYRAPTHASNQVIIEISNAAWLDRPELVMRETILQVFCTVVRVGRISEDVYHVEAMMQSGKIYPLMKDLSGLLIARYIETKIESFLQIKDEEVPGEAKL